VLRHYNIIILKSHNRNYFSSQLFQFQTYFLHKYLYNLNLISFVKNISKPTLSTRDCMHQLLWRECIFDAETNTCWYLDCV